MAELLDFDPLTGVAHYFSHDEMTHLSTIHTVEDVEPLLDYTKALARDGGTDQGIKKGFWLYAKIPTVVQLKMRAKGIDISDPTATKRILEEINTHYAHLKTTQKVEGGKLKQLYLPSGTKTSR